MRYSLRSKLTVSYLLIVVIIVGLISVIANTYIKQQFQDYVINRQEKQTNEIIGLIKEQYQIDQAFDTAYLGRIGMHALGKGMTIEILDANNKLIWSAYHHNDGLCEAMIFDIQENMYSYHPNWNGEYEEKTYSLTNNNLEIGTLITGYIGPYYFNNEELTFIKAFNNLFIIIGIISLLLAFMLGVVMSIRISTPLKKVAKKALLLSEGSYKERLSEHSNTQEIEMLITTINKLSDALQNKEQLRKQLTQDVAHELRTPLTSVQGHMEAMIDGIWEMDTQRLSSCYDEIIRIQRLVGGLENLSGLENENILLHKEEFDISELILRLLDNYEKELLAKDIHVRYDSKNVIIYADPDKMSQVLNNLISNSIKYSNDGAKIEIRITNHQSTTELRFSDTGIGISESDLPLIFERFYRVDKSRNHKTGGIGVGLTITKAIIDAHGGTITASSQLNKGTEFTIMLPKKES